MPLPFNHLHLSSALQKRKGEGGRAGEGLREGGRGKKAQTKRKGEWLPCGVNVCVNSESEKVG